MLDFFLHAPSSMHNDPAQGRTAIINITFLGEGKSDFCRWLRPFGGERIKICEVKLWIRKALKIARKNTKIKK